MESVVLVIHLILALAIIGLVLLQRSEGGGLGIGGGGGGLGGLASARGTANALTKMTAFCAAAFFITSLTLGVLAGGHSRQNTGVLEDINPAEIQAPVPEVAPPVGVTYTPPEEIPTPSTPSEGQSMIKGVADDMQDAAEEAGSENSEAVQQELEQIEGAVEELVDETQPDNLNP